MRYFFLVCLIGLGLSLISFGLITPGDRLASIDPHHPAALVLNFEGDLRAFGSASRELARGLVEEFLNPYRERFQHKTASQSPLP